MVLQRIISYHEAKTLRGLVILTPIKSIFRFDDNKTLGRHFMVQIYGFKYFYVTTLDFIHYNRQGILDIEEYLNSGS